MEISEKISDQPSFAEASEGKENIVTAWFFWHFYEMPQFLLLMWKNYIWFGANFFSIPLLLKTFFSPWRRYAWRYPKGFDPGEFFSTLISNVFSRLVGAIVRSFLVIVGIIVQIFILVAGGVVFLLWILIPLILVLLISFIVIF